MGEGSLKGGRRGDLVDGGVFEGRGGTLREECWLGMDSGREGGSALVGGGVYVGEMQSGLVIFWSNPPLQKKLTDAVQKAFFEDIPRGDSRTKLSEHAWNSRVPRLGSLPSHDRFKTAISTGHFSVWFQYFYQAPMFVLPARVTGALAFIGSLISLGGITYSNPMYGSLCITTSAP